MSEPLSINASVKKWITWYFLLSFSTIYNSGVLLMNFSDFGNAKNGIFDFSVKSHINSTLQVIAQLKRLKFGIIR